MGIISSEPRGHADVLRDNLHRAGLSQRAGARALKLDDRTMRRYCAGNVKIPVAVLLASSRLPVADRKLRVTRLLTTGHLAAGNASMTKTQCLANSRKLLQAIEYLLGYTDELTTE